VGDVRHRDGASLILALARNCGNLLRDAKGEGQEKKIEAQSTDMCNRDGPTRMSDDAPVMGAEQRGRVILRTSCANQKWEEHGEERKTI
jgi:hypothetical protein